MGATTIAKEYEQALCDPVREEYKAIIDAGFIVQIDDPRLFTYYMMTPGASVAYLKFAALADGARLASRQLWG